MSDERNIAINDVVIVGGGSAGWLLAGLIASEFIGSDVSDVRVTLIESPNVKTVGVGEGTWPTMRGTLQKIGISETDFLLRCSASFKQGTRFVGWTTGDDADTYYHPFSVPAGYTEINLVPFWQPHRDEVSFANAVTVQGHVCDRNLAPKQLETPEYAYVANYGYHLDAGKFAELLQEHCASRLGVRHVVDHVTSINGDLDSDIRSVTTTEHGNIEGDLFVDCTGFAALLLGKHYQVPYEDKRHILFNDSALALQVPYSSDMDPIASQTISTARSAGWIWDIGLPSRRGVGYAYSSRHSSDDEAVETLKAYVRATSGVSTDSLEPRKIEFRPGHRREFWHRNCVAVGMSAGFLEPLEASALVLIELAGKMISEELPANRDDMDVVARRYNEIFRYRWDRIIDFLKLHYVLSERDDSEYWKENRRSNSIPESLRELMALWRYHPPGHHHLGQVDEIFSAASYQYVLYGMGFRTAGRESSRQSADAGKARQLFQDNSKRAEKLVANLPSNRKLLTLIGERELQKGA